MKSGNLSRRMMTDEGWVYFCNVCGEYKGKKQFYSRSKAPFKIDTKCKIHNKKQLEDDAEMKYLNLHGVRKEQFDEAQLVLERLGYLFCDGCPSVHQQFLKKHKLNG